MRNEPTVLSVSQLTTYIRALLEGDARLDSVHVCGEISNFTNHTRSGHWYFSVKDSVSVLRVVMFRTANQRLRFSPQDGLRVLIRGRITVYERDGTYQLQAEDMQPDGAGALALAFHQLRMRLAEEGLFDASRKQALPRYPMTVGVITSPIGAARRDIENVLARRFPCAEILFVPVLVQGAAAPMQLAEAVRRVNADGRADVIIIGRGGGSVEELWAFNDEQVVRAVAASQIPIISAVGHETDVTLCDFAADCRAPTPSAAAELAVPDGAELQLQLKSMKQRLRSATEHTVSQSERAWQLLTDRSALRDPLQIFAHAEERLRYVTERFYHISNQMLIHPQQRLMNLCGRLDALSPLRVLARGYTAVRREKWITSAAELNAGDRISVVFQDGEADCAVINRHSQKEQEHGEKGNI